MWKPILATSAALLMVGTTVVTAQNWSGPEAGGGRGFGPNAEGRGFGPNAEGRGFGPNMQGYGYERGFEGPGYRGDFRGRGDRRGFEGRRYQPSAEDMRAFADARLAGLKAGLALKPEQEKLWPAFEAAARDLQSMRIARITNPPSVEPQRLSPLEMLQRRANTMVERGNALKKLADAAVPLYGSLDDSQKRRFDMLSRAGGYRDFSDRTRDRERMRDWDDNRRQDRRDRDFRRGEDQSQSTEGGNRLPYSTSAAIVLPAPRHDRRRMGAAGLKRPGGYPQTLGKSLS